MRVPLTRPLVTKVKLSTICIFFYYEVLLGQSRTVNELLDFHYKRKMKKRKNEKIPKKY
jgi:hypothetical protein